jgi:chemotaxis protein CheZ
MLQKKGNVKMTEEQLVKELNALAQFIDRAKHDIANIRADEIQSKHIPSATDELDAIIEATEEATGTIMDACEAIQNAVAGKDVQDAVVTEVMKIFEACSFQDITGQRISKVVKALQSVEEKVAALLSTFGKGLVSSEALPEEVKTGDAALLNGPQLKGQGVSQDDIDRLLNS